MIIATFICFKFGENEHWKENLALCILYSVGLKLIPDFKLISLVHVFIYVSFSFRPQYSCWMWQEGWFLPSLDRSELRMFSTRHQACKNCFHKITKLCQRSGSSVTWPNDWTSNRIRAQFLDFFCKKHDHQFVKSSSVIPRKDEGVYFTNAGMNQVMLLIVTKSVMNMLKWPVLHLQKYLMLLYEKVLI